jgi:hypothetical protein
MTDWNPKGWIDMYQRLDGDLDDDYKSKALLQVAESLVGVPNTDARVYEALYFWDPPGFQKRMALSQHKCALFALAVLRGCGYLLPEDHKAYAWRFGTLKPPTGARPPQDAMTQLRQLPGWKRANEISQPGTITIIHRPGDPKTTHALVIERVENGLLSSFDGGEKSPVRREVRTIIRIGGKWCLRDKLMGNREILGWANVEGLTIGRSYMVAG